MFLVDFSIRVYKYFSKMTKLIQVTKFEHSFFKGFVHFIWKWFIYYSKKKLKNGTINSKGKAIKRTNNLKERKVQRKREMQLFVQNSLLTIIFLPL